MSLSRLVVLALVAAICVVPVAAQSLLSGDAAAFQPQRKLPASSSDRIRVDQFRLPLSPPSEVDSHNSILPVGGDPVPASMGPVHRFLGKGAPPEDSASTCYSMRSYRVKREDPNSDATTLVGYSTCQSAARFQVKSVEGVQELIRR
jgi:hypothetical protein